MSPAPKVAFEMETGVKSLSTANSTQIRRRICCFQEFRCPVELLYFLVRSQPQLRNDKCIMMHYTNWINSALSQQ